MKKLSSIFLITSIFLGAVINNHAQPFITRQPTNQSVSLGAGVKFLVSATSANPPILFQWRLGTTDVPTATNSTLTLTNIQTINAGDYHAVLTDGSGSVTSLVAHLEVDPTFNKITLGPIVTDAADGESAAWVDIDGDGYLDLSVGNNNGASVFYLNDRKGGFTKISSGALASVGTLFTTAWADYDNDGLPDLLGKRPGQILLFHQSSGGIFTELTLTGNNAWNAATWGDYDNDGFLDFLVIGDNKRSLWHNDGQGGFNLVTNTPIDVSAAFSVTWVDYDNDGDLDLLVCNQGRPNSFYRNDGAGGFLSITNLPFVNDGDGTSVGAAWGDFDNDGFLDVVISHAAIPGGDAEQRPPRLYHNNRDGTFTRVQEDVFSDPAGGATCGWGDYDNDGWLDLFVVDFLGRANLLYHNNGDGTFTRIRSGSLANDNGSSVAGIWGDYDPEVYPTCGNYWWDMPADRHNQGCNISFADGHVIHWRWRFPKKFKGIHPQKVASLLEDPQQNDLKDLRQMQAWRNP